MSTKPVVLITGASRGIGSATAVEFRARGYDLFLTAPAGEALSSDASLHGDLADERFPAALIEAVIQRFGRIDVLVNNAAWRELSTMRDTTPESWQKTLQVCLTAPAMLAKLAAPHMEKRKRGVIINISSIMSSHATGAAPAYVAAKGAIESLTYDLAALYGPSGVRVLAVCPGAIDTDMSRDVAKDEQDPIRTHSLRTIPLRRWGRPEEVAKVIAMLASDEASYITGTTIAVDGGWAHQLYPHDLGQSS